MYLIKNSFGSHTASHIILLTVTVTGVRGHFVSNGVIQSLSFDEKNTKAFLYMLKTIVHRFPDPALRGEFLLYR